MKEKVVAVNKDPDGNILSVKTDRGQVYRFDQAIRQVESGRLVGIEIELVMDNSFKKLIRHPRK